jgi:hypothetical protein
MGLSFLQARREEGTDFLQALPVSIRKDLIAAAAGEKKGGEENGLKRFARVGAFSENALQQFAGLAVPGLKIRRIKGSLPQAVNLSQLSLQAVVMFSGLIDIIHRKQRLAFVHSLF